MAGVLASGFDDTERLHQRHQLTVLAIGLVRAGLRSGTQAIVRTYPVLARRYNI